MRERPGVGLSRAVASVAVCFAGIAALSAQTGAAPTILFERDIQPIFSQHCVACHGSAMQLSGLRLDRREEAMKGGYSGPVIHQGDAAGSKLVRLVSGLDEKVVMPPSGPRLDDSQVSLLRAWIDQGAPWPESTDAETANVSAPRSEHWAFQPIKRPEPPAVAGTAWVRNSIDQFVLVALEARGISPSPEADRATLIRRLSLDLTGLPPTPEEVGAFISDNRPEAYVELVDRLLNSPHYGERWARHWLDLARYADSDGYRSDSFRPNAWRWREWVINAVNEDMPFDQFTVEQIAGDLLPNASTSQKVATGFHRNTLTNHEGGTDPEQFRVEQIYDRINTVGTVWLGLTLGCTQCHDHKYDPISQKEYYQLYAFFNQTEEVEIDAPLAGERGPYLQWRPQYLAERTALLKKYDVPARMKEWERGLLQAAEDSGVRPDWDIAFDDLRTALDHGERILRTPQEQRSWKRQKSLADYFVRNYQRVVDKETAKALDYASLATQLAGLDTKYPQLSQAPVIRRDSIPRQTRIHVRGQYRDLGIPVEPSVPRFLHPLEAPHPTRLDLAHWLVAEDNPLTARVTVNHFWQELFGIGLVESSDNFGSQGEKPSHPELLDWLASEFRDKGWSRRRLLRTIVLSATYRQASEPRLELRETDPANRLLARQNRLRLSAEQLRDAALSSAGLLSDQVGGRSVRLPVPGEAKEHESPKDGDSHGGKDLYRRTLYTAYMRMAPHPYFANFDMPNAYGPTCRRERSNTPLQALNLLNDRTFIDAAYALALRVIELETNDRARGRLAFRLVVSRDPEPWELDVLNTGLERYRTILRENPADAGLLAPLSGGDASQVDTAAWTATASALLNTEEFLTRP